MSDYVVERDWWFSFDEITDLVRRDYAVFCNGRTSMSVWINNQTPVYCLLLGTWISLVREVGGDMLANALYERLVVNGVSNTISACADEADCLVNHYHKSDTPCHIPKFAKIVDWFAYEVANLNPKEQRQVLVFPKRFSPYVRKSHSVLSEAVGISFCDTQRYLSKVIVPRLKRFLKRPGHAKFGNISYKFRFVFAVARRLILSIIGEHPSNRDRNMLPRFGPGSSRHCDDVSLVNKYQHMVSVGYYVPSMPVHYVEKQDRVYTGFTLTEHPDHRQKWILNGCAAPSTDLIDRFLGIGPLYQITRLSDVPKNYKVRRGIAIEAPENISDELKLADDLDRRISSSRHANQMPLHNQAVQVKRILHALELGSIGSVDQSHASDSVTKVLVQLLFPPSWWEVIIRTVPLSFVESETDRKPKILHSLATMGCGCTFVIETLVFYALLYGFRMYYMYCQRKIHLHDILQLPVCDDISAYGDDTTFLGEFIPDLIRDMTYLGFEVNRSKTFWNGNFRESCGAEFLRYHGEILDLKAIYWPRLTVKGGLDQWKKPAREWKNEEADVQPSIVRLIELQHRLYRHGFPQTAESLGRNILANLPEMTTSEPFSDRADVWSTEDHSIHAVYVGPQLHVNRDWRSLPGGLFLPNGYVLAEMWDDYVLSSASGLNLAEPLLFRERQFHCRIRYKGTLQPHSTDRGRLTYGELLRTEMLLNQCGRKRYRLSFRVWFAERQKSPAASTRLSDWVDYATSSDGPSLSLASVAGSSVMTFEYEC